MRRGARLHRKPRRVRPRGIDSLIALHKRLGEANGTEHERRADRILERRSRRDVGEAAGSDGCVARTDQRSRAESVYRSNAASECSTSAAAAAKRRCAWPHAAQRSTASTFPNRCSRALANARPRRVASATFVLGDAAVTRFDTNLRSCVLAFRRDVLQRPHRCVHEHPHRALRAGGKLCFVCWQPPQLNAWISAPFCVARPLLPPQPTLDPRAPGPFAFAEPDYVRADSHRRRLPRHRHRCTHDHADARARRRYGARNGLRSRPLEPLVGGNRSGAALARHRCGARTVAGRADGVRRLARRCRAGSSTRRLRF